MKLVVSIQTLRAFAAIAVVLVHAGKDAAAFSGIEQVHVVGDWGAIGVDIFFVISGFIMYMTACRTDVPAGRFVVERFARIVPIYWLATFVMLALALASRSQLRPTLSEVLLSLAFIPHYDGVGLIKPVLSVGWTLNYEMFFYAVLACALLFRRAQLALVTLALVALVGAGLAVPPSGPALAAYSSPLLFEFLAGLWIGYLWNRGYRPSRFAGILFALTALAWFTAANMVALVEGGWVRFFGWAAPAALIVLAALAFETSRLMGTRIGLALGAASYSIYLVHTLVLILLGRIWHLFGITSPWVTLPLAMVICVLAGQACHRWVEQPLGRTARASLLALFEGRRRRAPSVVQ